MIPLNFCCALACGNSDGTPVSSMNSKDRSFVGTQVLNGDGLRRTK
jgi:hypothetical protein